MSDCCSGKNPEPKKPCCGGGKEEASSPSCCGGGGDPPKEGDSCCGGRGKVDWLLWGSLSLVAAGIAGHFIGAGPGWWQTFAHGSWELMTKAWWGILIGIVAVGVLGQVPKEVVSRLLGRGGTIGGIVRATFAGTLLDLCNHGILMVGMQLYRKGASLGQVIAFLVSSPWNSLSLTLILIGLIGLKWTLAFIALSMVIGIISGRIADFLVKRGALPANRHTVEVDADYRLRDGLREVGKNIRPGGGNLGRMVRGGLSESRMILRWIFFGFAMAAAVRAFVPTEVFNQYFGPSLLGLLLTLVATSVIEVCSEGSSPIAADLLNRAGAPGNAFTFLMAGAATDYTEIMALKETTKSWKATFALPLITTPQVLVISWLLNQS
ncbi:permease [Haloferula sp. A504]|uniref:permease n=1 Tax=Haloferula sp. A504 TaxID=3373601 RepID=UPI0031C54928|nr:permease [Verrucomicrobiaceae bacterium E54]